MGIVQTYPTWPAPELHMYSTRNTSDLPVSSPNGPTSKAQVDDVTNTSAISIKQKKHQSFTKNDSFSDLELATLGICCIDFASSALPQPLSHPFEPPRFNVSERLLHLVSSRWGSTFSRAGDHNTASCSLWASQSRDVRDTCVFSQNQAS